MQPTSKKLYRTQSAISNVLLMHMDELRLVKRDLAKWWPTITDEPFIGEVVGCPNMRGRMLATNGLEALCVTSGGDPFFCHFRNFVCDEEYDEDGNQLTKLQSKLNQCLLPFQWWWASNRHHDTPDMKARRNEERKAAKRAHNGGSSHKVLSEDKTKRALMIYE